MIDSKFFILGQYYKTVKLVEGYEALFIRPRKCLEKGTYDCDALLEGWDFMRCFSNIIDDGILIKCPAPTSHKQEELDI